MVAKRFDGLTKAQDEALTAIALGGSGLRAHRKTIEALLKRGLIYRRGEEEVGRDRFGVITVPVYEMPLREHMRWCQWCAETFPDDEPTEDDDPTPYCMRCGSKTYAGCHCGPRADND